jgi:hypothetical protein
MNTSVSEVKEIKVLSNENTEIKAIEIKDATREQLIEEIHKLNHIVYNLSIKKTSLKDALNISLTSNVLELLEEFTFSKSEFRSSKWERLFFAILSFKAGKNGNVSLEIQNKIANEFPNLWESKLSSTLGKVK